MADVQFDVEDLRRAPDLLRKLASRLQEAENENENLKEKVAEYETSARVETLIEKMERRGQDVDGDSMQDKVATVLDRHQDLNALEAALDLMPPNGSHFSIGHASGNGSSDFEAFLLGDID